MAKEIELLGGPKDGVSVDDDGLAYIVFPTKPWYEKPMEHIYVRGDTKWGKMYLYDGLRVAV